MASQLPSLPAAAHAPAQATGVFAGAAPNGVPKQWVRTNRGIILKNGADEPLRLLCNDAYQASLSEVPPMIPAPDGLLVADYTAGLMRISSDGCTAQPLDIPLAGRHVADLAATADPDHYLALLSPSQPQTGVVLVSRDAGHTWAAAADVAAFGTAMLGAPSDAERVYISAVAETADGSPSNQLLVSTDGAQTFATHQLELTDAEVRAYVVGVDPLDADRLFMRPLAGDPDIPERLLLSEDAGNTFSEVYSAVGPLVFAIDAETAWLGSKAGLYRSRDRGKTFEAVTEAPDYVGCLRPGADGLLVCGHQDNEFGIFQADSKAAHFAPYLRFADVTKQVACSDSLLGLCQTNLDDWLLEVAPAAGGGAGSGPLNGGSGASGSAGGASTPTPKSQHSSGCNFGALPARGFAPFALVLGAWCALRRFLRTTNRQVRARRAPASAK